MKSNYELLSIGSFALKMVKTNINYRLIGWSQQSWIPISPTLCYWITSSTKKPRACNKSFAQELGIKL